MTAAGVPSVRLRPVSDDDLAIFRRFAAEPGLVGRDRAGFRDAAEPDRRFQRDGYLGDDLFAYSAHSPASEGWESR